VTCSTRLPPPLAEQVRADAERTRRTVSQIVLLIVESYYSERSSA
jgi:hypothetical protein